MRARRLRERVRAGAPPTCRGAGGGQGVLSAAKPARPAQDSRRGACAVRRASRGALTIDSHQQPGSPAAAAETRAATRAGEPPFRKPGRPLRARRSRARHFDVASSRLTAAATAFRKRTIRGPHRDATARSPNDRTVLDRGDRLSSRAAPPPSHGSARSRRCRRGRSGRDRWRGCTRPRAVGTHSSPPALSAMLWSPSSLYICPMKVREVAE